MLGDQEDCIDGEFARAERERIGNRRAQADPLPARLGSAQVCLGRRLLDEQAGVAAGRDR